MKGGITAVTSTRYNGQFAQLINRDTATKRVRRVIQEELTELQRYVILAYYFQEKKIPQIARERGVHKSTVSRTLHRAEQRLKRCLKY